jgi:hypothetical protein
MSVDLKSRNVRIVYSDSKQLYNFVFSGVTELNINFETVLGEVQGIYKTTLQPWYYKPVTINIKGEMYLGAFQGSDDLHSKGESTVRNMSSQINAFNQLFKSGEFERQKVYLTIDQEPYNFNGYITSFDYTESVSKPFVLDYSIKFYGLVYDHTALARENVAKDVAKTKAK